MAGERESHSLGLFVAWVVGMSILGLVIWIVYAVAAQTGGAEAACGPSFLWASWSGGGQATAGSLTAAAVLGGSLLVLAGVAAWRVWLKLGFLFTGFVGLYALGLAVLWYTTPPIWGPRYC